MSILGVSAFHHDSAATLIKKGRIIGACHEERFTRKKFDNNWPQQSIDYLHNKANGIKIVVFYDKDNKGDSKSLIKKFNVSLVKNIDKAKNINDPQWFF